MASLACHLACTAAACVLQPVKLAPAAWACIPGSSRRGSDTPERALPVLLRKPAVAGLPWHQLGLRLCR